MTMLPTPRGVLTPDRLLAELTWLRVGGPADWLFQPADEADLAEFLAALDRGVAVFPMGVGSNLIVRDGGIRAVVIRLGRGFNGIAIEGDRVVAGAAALDAHVARRAAEAGLDLTFLRTIPGQHRWRGADERRLLRVLCGGCAGGGPGRHAGGRWRCFRRLR
jgi:UDP-N-acetylmuramate dehydrogenase